MSINTTYVMREEVIGLLLEAKTKTRCSFEQLITLVMRKMLKDHHRYHRDDRRIEYQKRFDEKTKLPIKKFRVKMEFLIREYEYFQDMRKFFKRSISLLMAIAVFTYLDEVVEKILKKDIEAIEADNYPFEEYAIMEKCIENIPTFRIWWGLPANLKLLLTK